MQRYLAQVIDQRCPYVPKRARNRAVHSTLADVLDELHAYDGPALGRQQLEQHVSRVIQAHALDMLRSL